ncbi:hypothetical protein LTR10_022455 [Elasticomyces elasticus]|uniref:Xylanolytic transcriptional activator regulatory domain-containing protein n=1 Tax=Exophiala sideris TaxID=1016849 RepID=A0ABR0J2I0_9EURO|nr:hypothetical protein LTR10_022455 [Elasticomyces elasticus]KAK5024891.1 hypothetical protein LTS07_008269 [Exophiala sideris]KAK5054930.1 hypothetical protein LTR69_008498 [Exophiala sideris]KAK5179809.1 hypothetical protein LTR44_007625 [Eurotiomycetes sp. CCFEE 6388]
MLLNTPPKVNPIDVESHKLHGQSCYYEPPAKRKHSVHCGGDNKTGKGPSSPKRARSSREPAPLQDQVIPSAALPTLEDQASCGMSEADHMPVTTFDFSMPQLKQMCTEIAPLPSKDSQTSTVVSKSVEIPVDQGPVSTDVDGWNATMPTPSFSFGDTLDIDDWLNFGTDSSLLPPMGHVDHAFEAYSNVWFASVEPKSRPSLFTAPMQRSPIAQLYSRAHSPAMDKDSIGPREYVPTSIEIDAQLVFPDMEELSLYEVDQEDLAHVDEVTADIAQRIADYTAQLQRNGPYPPFVEMRIPPAAVLNSWVQLYFEHFHPVFPILHKPSFSGSDAHWLLIFAVAAIGAHFSSLQGAHLCARAMHELVRRQAASMCEQRNEYGRELFMVQVCLLGHVGLMYSGEQRTLEVAEILQGLPPALARRKGLFMNRMSYEKFSQMQLTLNQKWQVWTLDEEMRRTGFGVFFHDNFDLSRLVRVEELQMSLPQPEERWSATSAQSWASLPSGISSEKELLLEGVIRNDSWKVTWRKIGILGKQVLLQQLFDVMNSRSSHPGCPSFSENDKLKAENTLCELLVMTEDEESEQQLSELKSLIANQLLIFNAFTVRKSPTRNINAVALKVIYGTMDDQAWAHLGQQWKQAAAQGRLAVFWAARVVHVVRSHRCAHFATPVCLLRAVLVLWLYSSLAEKQKDDFQQPPPAPSVVLGTRSMQSMRSLDWIEAGWSGVKLPGIGNLFCAQGRCKMLDESISLMRSLKCWAISTSYTQLLVRLRAGENPPPNDRTINGTV